MKDFDEIDYCEHPDHNVNVEYYARKKSPSVVEWLTEHIIPVDPKTWSNNRGHNRVKCCLACVYAEGMKRSKP
ncbi:MAG TPA: hypothetical protein VE130_07815 [Nitrososphaeraceae archaeon]|nr:hypothetical protein [Nitrososphaeraceae archaeon]